MEELPAESVAAPHAPAQWEKGSPSPWREQTRGPHGVKARVVVRAHRRPGPTPSAIQPFQSSEGIQHSPQPISPFSETAQYFITSVSPSQVYHLLEDRGCFFLLAVPRKMLNKFNECRKEGMSSDLEGMLLPMLSSVMKIQLDTTN